jgi:hypothetical protein
VYEHVLVRVYVWKEKLGVVHDALDKDDNLVYMVFVISRVLLAQRLHDVYEHVLVRVYVWKEKLGVVHDAIDKDANVGVHWLAARLAVAVLLRGQARGNVVLDKGLDPGRAFAGVCPLPLGHLLPSVLGVPILVHSLVQPGGIVIYSTGENARFFTR